MAGGSNYPHEDLPEDYFGGGKHLQRDPDDFPDLDQLFNRLRAGGGGAKVGGAVVVSPGVSVAVVFPTAFPAGSDVRVVPSAEENVNCWPSAVSETGFTLNISGALGADVQCGWMAFAV